MKKTLKQFLRPAVFLLRSYREALIDAKRFRHACSLFSGVQRREQAIAQLTIDYHRLEKGLSLPETRAGFGEDVIERLVRNLPRYIAAYGHDEISDIVLNSLSAYITHNERLEHPVPHVVSFLAAQTESRYPAHHQGGTLRTTADDIVARARIDAEAFFLSRHSIRQFKDQLVPQELLNRAVELAAKAPSVCNRQGGRAYLTTKPADIQQALKFQNGNRGFGHTVPALAVICSDFDIFEKLGERNQGWIDGGLFAMSFVYALHALGLGTCMLNWSVTNKHDLKFRGAFDIPDNHGVICMIAIGHIPDDLVVAQSTRRPTSHFKLSLEPVKESVY